MRQIFKHRFSSLKLTAAAIPACAVWAATAHAAPKYYVGGAVGSWSSTASWSTALNGSGGAAIPVAGDTVFITAAAGSSRTISYDTATTPALGAITVDYVGGGGSFAMTMSQSSNTLNTSGPMTIGASGYGIDAQSGGTVNLLSNASLYLGYNSSGTGTYTLGTSGGGSGAGALSVSGNEYIGDNGSGSFVQNSGTNTLSGASSVLYVAFNASNSASYTITGGNLQAGGSDANGVSEYVAYNGSVSGVFTQSAGVNGMTSGLTVGYANNSVTTSGYINGSYVLGVAGGNTTNAVLTVGGNETIGWFGLGSFIQNSASHIINGSALYLGYANGSGGLYTLSGGNLNINSGSVYIGYNGSGEFTQSGGNVTLSGSSSVLYVAFNANNGAIYTMSGGNLQTNGSDANGVSEYIAYNGSVSGVFTQNAGVNGMTAGLTVGFANNNVTTLGYINGSYVLGVAGGNANNAVLTVGGNETIGWSGVGSFIQNSGTHVINGSALYLGYTNGSGGLYTLSGGNLNINSGSAYIGYNGSGQFTQNGGTITLSGPSSVLYVAFNASNGTSYTMSGGNLQASGSDAHGISEYVAYNGSVSGIFTQNAGVNAMSAGLTVGFANNNVTSLGYINGSYILGVAGGNANNALLTVGGNETIGWYGLGSIIQNSGTHAVNGSALYLGYANGSGGLFTLTGGTLNLGAGSEYVGYSGAGQFTQTGGSNNISGGLMIAAMNGSLGVYNLNGNGSQLNVGGSVQVGGDSSEAGGAGVLGISGGTATVNGTLKIWNSTGSAVNFSGGTLSVGTLDISGNPSAFHWTGGTLSFLPAIVIDPNFVLGSSISLNNSFGLGSSVSITNDGLLNLSGGLITTPTLINESMFRYTAGTLAGRLVNEATAVLSGPGLNVSGGMVNYSGLTLGSSTVATSVYFGSTGLDNSGNASVLNSTTIAGTVINDYGGNLTTTGSGTIVGTFTNQGTLQPAFIAITGAMTNSGYISLPALSTLNAQGGLTNSGIIHMQSGRIIGGGIVNNPGGQIVFDPASVEAISGFSQPFSNAGGIIIVGALNQVTFSSFSPGNTAGGDIQIANMGTLTTSTFLNSGTIEIQGASAALNGGAINNTGSITGNGRISNSLLNTGVIEASGGKLTISGAGCTNPTGGQIILDAGVTLQYAQGLSSTAGFITNLGGTFDNNNLPLLNTGAITGNGIFRTGGTGLTNTVGAVIDVTAGTSFFGPLIQNGSMRVSGSTTSFNGNVTEGSAGTIKITAGTVYFLGNNSTSISGLYTSDPSDNYFNGLTINSTGTVTGGGGDRFFVGNGAALLNFGTFNSTGTLSAATIVNSGTFTQTGTLVEAGNFTNSGNATIGGTQNWSAGTTFTNTAGIATFTSDVGAAASTLTVDAVGGTIIFSSTQHLAAVSVGSGAIVQLIGSGSGRRSIAYTPSLELTGNLDLAANDLDVQSGASPALAAVTNLVRQGYDNGQWLGTGITSSAAALDSTHLTAVAVMLNNNGSGGILYASLDGSPVALNDVLVKYTYYGDTNLDGKVDGSDYARIDNGYLSHNSLTGWNNGDFNYDGLIDGSDYTLIDNAFNAQGAQLDAELATTPAGQISGNTSVPEPAAVSLLGIAAVVTLSRRRVQRRLLLKTDRPASTDFQTASSCS